MPPGFRGVVSCKTGDLVTGCNVLSPPPPNVADTVKAGLTSGAYPVSIGMRSERLEKRNLSLSFSHVK